MCVSGCKRGGQHLGLAGSGGAQAGLDDFDDVAGVFGGADCRGTGAHPVDELHDVDEHVVLVNITMRIVDIRQNPLIATPATMRVRVGHIAPWIGERLSVDVQADNVATCAKVTATEALGHTPGRHTVGHGKDVVAEIDEDEGVVVGIAGHHLAAKLAEGEPDTGHGRDALRRTKDAGETVQGIDGHVVERATAGFAVVPRGVDGGERVGAGAVLFVFVVAPEGGATDGPAEIADGAVGDEVFDGLVVRAVHFTRRCDQLEACRSSTIDEVGGLGGSRGHGFVEMDVFASSNGVTPLLVVHADGGGEGDEVDVCMGQEVVVVGEVLWEAEFGGGGLRPAGSGVADGDQLDEGGDVGL